MSTRVTFLIVDRTTGQVISSGRCSAATLAAQAPDPDHAAVLEGAAQIVERDDHGYPVRVDVAALPSNTASDAASDAARAAAQVVTPR